MTIQNLVVSSKQTFNMIFKKKYKCFFKTLIILYFGFKCDSHAQWRDLNTARILWVLDLKGFQDMQRVNAMDIHNFYQIPASKFTYKKDFKQNL